MKGERITWEKTTQSLAEYFGNQKNNGGNINWKCIELLFGKKGLRNSFSKNGNTFKKTSKDYEQWLIIKNTPICKQNTT
jgi:hypothetical protein